MTVVRSRWRTAFAGAVVVRGGTVSVRIAVFPMRRKSPAPGCELAFRVTQYKLSTNNLSNQLLCNHMTYIN